MRVLLQRPCRRIPLLLMLMLLLLLLDVPEGFAQVPPAAEIRPSGGSRFMHQPPELPDFFRLRPLVFNPEGWTGIAMSAATREELGEWLGRASRYFGTSHLCALVRPETVPEHPQAGSAKRAADRLAYVQALLTHWGVSNGVVSESDWDWPEAPDRLEIQLLPCKPPSPPSPQP